MNQVNLIGTVGESNFEDHPTEGKKSELKVHCKDKDYKGEDKEEWINAVAYGKTLTDKTKTIGYGDSVAINGRILKLSDGPTVVEIREIIVFKSKGSPSEVEQTA